MNPKADPYEDALQILDDLLEHFEPYLSSRGECALLLVREALREKRDREAEEAARD